MGIDNLIKDCIGIVKSSKVDSFKTRKINIIDGFEVSVEISIFPVREKYRPLSYNMQMPQVIKDAKEPE